MARVGVTKKKPRVTALSRVKDKLRRVTDQLESRERELAEATEQQIATGEILRVIASSPTDIQPVLDAIVESAARVCGIDDVVLRLHEGELLWFCGLILVPYPTVAARRSVSMNHSFTGCASMARSTFPTSARQNDFPRSVRARARFLLVPLRQQGELIGA